MIPRPGRPAKGGVAYDTRCHKELATAPPSAEPGQGVG